MLANCQFSLDVEPPMRIIKATEYWTVTLSFQYSLVPGDEVKSIEWYHLGNPRREIKTSEGESNSLTLVLDC